MVKMKDLILGAILGVTLAGCTEPRGEAAAMNEMEIQEQPLQTDSISDPAYVLGRSMNLIDGRVKNLADYHGRVVMMVNVASRCGMTPQYEGLQALYEQRKEAGFVILGFPANNFGGQEPGTNEEIVEFCTGEYGVTFPMFEKISVKGEDQHSLYEQLASQPEPIGGDPEWNFTKFLVDRSGRIVARFGPRTEPTDSAMGAKIDELLAGTEPG